MILSLSRTEPASDTPFLSNQAAPTINSGRMDLPWLLESSGELLSIGNQQQHHGTCDGASPCLNEQLASAEAALLEPSPINTGRMRVVDKVELGGPDFAFSSNVFPFARNYQPAVAPLPVATAVSGEDFSVGIEDRLGRARRLLTTTMKVIERDSPQLLFHDIFQREYGALPHTSMPAVCTVRMQQQEAPDATGGFHTQMQGASSPVAEEDEVSSDDDDTKPRRQSAMQDLNHSDRWNEKFAGLREFVRQHGHGRVPVRYRQNMPLSKWAKRQRYQWKLKHEGKRSTLSDDREEKLNEIGFLWDIRLTVWEERFEELIEFKKVNGHCNVPISCQDFPKLGTWVKCQRRQWRLRSNGQQSSMSPARIAKLDAIGFSWEAR